MNTMLFLSISLVAALFLHGASAENTVKYEMACAIKQEKIAENNLNSDACLPHQEAVDEEMRDVLCNKRRVLSRNLVLDFQCDQMCVHPLPIWGFIMRIYKPFTSAALVFYISNHKAK